MKCTICKDNIRSLEDAVREQPTSKFYTHINCLPSLYNGSEYQPLLNFTNTHTPKETTVLKKLIGWCFG